MNTFVLNILAVSFLILVILGGFWYMDCGMKKIKEKHSKKI